jgi:RNA polymerase sigma-70 factor (ECF subfamily)
MLGDADAAADAAQEVFVKILEQQAPTNAEHLTRLLWRMATNRCLNVIYNHANQTRALDGEALLERIVSSDDVEERYMNRGVLRKLFDKHPESSRIIAVLHFLDGMTLKETAREVKMSVSGVRKRLRALRETLVELEDV